MSLRGTGIAMAESASGRVGQWHHSGPGLCRRHRPFQPFLSARAQRSDHIHAQPLPSAALHGARQVITAQRAGGGRLAAAAAAAPSASGDGEGAATDQAFLRVVLPTALALMLCNMDRICLSVAMVPIAGELGWAPGVQGVVQSAFLWGYLATQLLGGTLADRYGGKVVMGVGIAWFSVASLLLPLAAITPATAALGLTLPAVLVARFMVGFGEGVALPAMNNLVARSVPAAKRATALGAVFTGFHSGNLAGLLLSPLILAAWGWRALFYTFGVLGLPLLAVWTLAVPDAAPAAAGAPAQGAPIALRTLLSKRATWAIVVANFVNHWGYFIYLNWMPTYFYKVLGMDLKASSFLSFVPWLAMAIGSSAAGLLADGLVQRGAPVLAVRKGMQSVAFLGPVLALLVLSNPSVSPPLAVACLTAALGITSLGQAGFVANMSDIAPRHAGRLFGLCNTFGSLAGILGVSSVGVIVERTGSFSSVFQITAALYVVGTIVWNAYCSTEKQFD